MKSHERPNILLITVDQMRGDCLSYLGHPVVETPYLDSLAHTGVCFRNAYSATPVCIPARASIMTGMSQRSHGRVGYEDQVPWNYPHMLPAELAKAGYYTANVGKLHVYPTRKMCGFHMVELHDGYMHYNRNLTRNTPEEAWDRCDDYLVWLRDRAGSRHDVLDNGLHCNSVTIARPWHLEEELHPTNWVVTRSIDFLRRRDREMPFFLHMGFVRPHPPFDPPQVYFDRYDRMDIPEPYVGEWVEEGDMNGDGFYADPSRGLVDAKRMKRAQAAYYALISHIDEQIGRFLQAMYEYGVSQNTIILFTSDHGELLGDHRLYQKSLPYEGSTSIPFIVNDPTGQLKLARGSFVDEVIELRDIMPTLLQVAGAAIPPTVEGSSLLPLAKGEETTWRSYIHGELSKGPMSTHYITNGKEKYIWFSQTGEEQYFDLVDDPHELKELSQDKAYAARLEYCRNALIRELTGREEGYTDGTVLIAGRPPQTILKQVLSEV